jgi:hypothetical protein
MKLIRFVTGLRIRLNRRQWALLAGFFSNVAILMTGFSLTDQPIVSLQMTMERRWSIMAIGAVCLAIGVRIEGLRGRNR